MKRGRPKILTTAPNREAVAFCMLDLLTESVVIDEASRQARLIAEGADIDAVLKNIKKPARVRTQGTKSTALPMPRAEKIMAAISRVPRGERIVQSRLAPSIEKAVKELTGNYPLRARDSIREACKRIAPLVPPGLSAANVKKLYREWCEQKGIAP
jgi:hypothetical protein